MDLWRDLEQQPIATETLKEAFSRVPVLPAIERRVVAAIVGVVEPTKT